MTKHESKEQRLRVGHRHPDDRKALACDACGQVDDHPKHIIGESDGSTTVKHFDCCNDTSCVVQLDHAGDKRGLPLAAHLQENGEELAGLVAEALAAEASADDESGE